MPRDAQALEAIVREESSDAPQAGMRLRPFALRMWPYLLLAGLLWVVRYWHNADFGLYEDDLTHLPIAAAMSLREVFAFAFDAERIVNLYGQGHPFHYTFIYPLTNLGWRLADINGPYWIGFAIEALNVALLFALLRRLHSQAFAVLGGLAYVLYSADTTQALLTYSLGLHPSITLFLLAAHSYLSSKRWLAFLLVTLTLFTYESTFTVFFALPLVMAIANRRWSRGRGVDVLILGLILVGVVVLRMIVGDDRVGDLSLVEALSIPIIHMIQGPPVSIGTYLYRPLQALQGLDIEIAAVIALATVFFAFVITRLRFKTPEHELRTAFTALKQRTDRISSVWKSAPDQVRQLILLGLSGLVMLVLAYPLTFTVRAYAISGRDTRVHAAGVIGAAFLLGAVMLLVLWIADSFKRKKWAVILLSAWLGLMAAYGFVIQRDYRMAWRYQQEFWTELVPLVPDVEDGTVILVDPRGLQDTRQIGANYWNLPRVLDQLYDFPDEWNRPPRVYRLDEDWEAGIFTADELLALNAETVFAPPSTLGVFDPANAILIMTESGELERISGPILIGERELVFRPTVAVSEPEFARGFLYRYLIRGDAALGIKDE